MPLLAPIPRRDSPQAAVWLMLPVIIGLVWVRALTPISTSIYWDVDPRSALAANAPILVIGPTLLAWLNVASLAAAALGLAAHLRAGGAVRWGAVVLASMGSAACLFHMPRHADNLHSGASWLAAIWLGVAIVHLAERADVRRFLAAVIVAGAVCMAIDIAWYTAIEQPATTAQFLADEEGTIHSFGWEMNSPQHMAYHRRVLSAGATGAFGLSNVAGSLAAASAAAALGVAWMMYVEKRRAVAACAGVVAILGAAATAMTCSKGAILAWAMSVIALLAVALIARRWRWAMRGLPWLIPLLAGMVIAGVLARGEMGPPPSVEGERSLLFRAQYLQGAARIMMGQGVDARQGAWLLGVGPAEFRSLYPGVKNPLNPEDIASTHSVVVDWLVMLGIGGGAWAVWLMWQSISAGRGMGRAFTDHAGEPSASRVKVAQGAAAGGIEKRAVVMAGAAVFIAYGLDFFVAYAPVFGGMDVLARVVWIAQPMAFVLVTAVLGSSMGMSDRAARVALWLAAMVLIVHAQIEMTFFHWGSVVVALFYVASAGAADRGDDAPPVRLRGTGWAAPLVVLGITMGLIPGYLSPVVREQAALSSAAEALRSNDAANAVRLLTVACDVMPTDPAPRARLIERWLETARRGGEVPTPYIRRAAEEAVLASAPATLTPAVARDRSVLRARAAALDLLAWATTNEVRTREAAMTWREVVWRAPYALQDRVRLGDILWRLGEVDEARAVDEETLRLNDLAYLDPLVQLPPRELELLKARLVGR